MTRRFLVPCAWLFLSPAAIAGDVVAQQEYDKVIDKHRTVQALDSSLFGEQISARDGSVSFRMVDAELPGNGPTLQIVRSFQPRENNRYLDTSATDVGGWTLEIPRLKTVVNYSVNTSASSPYGWQVPGTNKNLRCTNFGPPGPVVLSPNYRYWDDHEWWAGYQLVDGSGNEQEVLLPGAGRPELTGYKAVTNNNWRIACLPTITGGLGEGFLATAPDGTRYWFDYLVYTSADTMTKPIEDTPMFKQSGGTSAKEVTTLSPTQDLLTRRHAMLLVSRIEDRFGNYLTYSYTAGALTGITASDGRALQVTRSGSQVTLKLGSATNFRSCFPRPS